MFHVKITKVAPTTDPTVPTADKESYVCGKINPGVSPFVGYEIKGFLHAEPECGKPLMADRYERNGAEHLGYFHTSPVKSIEVVDETTLKILTGNSEYLLEQLDT